MKKIARALKKNPTTPKKEGKKKQRQIKQYVQNPTTVCFRRKAKAVVEIWTKDKLIGRDSN